jgi:hypothetical protein
MITIDHRQNETLASHNVRYRALTLGRQPAARSAQRELAPLDNDLAGPKLALGMSHGVQPPRLRGRVAGRPSGQFADKPSMGATVAGTRRPVHQQRIAEDWC